MTRAFPQGLFMAVFIGHRREGTVPEESGMLDLFIDLQGCMEKFANMY